MVNTALIIGANRGLGLSLVKHYAQRLKATDVFATVRGKVEDGLFPKGVNIIEDVDASKKDCGKKVAEGLKGRKIDHVWVVAGLLKGEVCSVYTLHRVSTRQAVNETGLTRVGIRQSKLGR